jgi:hypothetical protein
MKCYSAIIFIILLFLVNALTAQIPTNGLIAYYPFDGDARDKSGNGFHGSYADDSTFTEDRFGNTYSALSLDGINDYIIVGSHNAFNLTSWTLNIWINITQISEGHKPLIAKDDNASDHINYQLSLVSNNRIRTSFETCKSESNYNLYSETVDYNNWMMLTYTFDENDGKTCLYIDGELVRSEIYKKSQCADIADLKFGHSKGQIEFAYFGGLMDDIRIYNRALSEDDIEKLYHENDWDNQNYGSIMGETISNNNSIEVTLRLLDLGSQIEYSTHSIGGDYSFNEIPYGRYRLIFEQAGYVSQRSVIIELSDEKPSEIVNFDIASITDEYDTSPKSIFITSRTRFDTLYKENDIDGNSILDTDQMFSLLNKLISLNEIRGKIIYIDNNPNNNISYADTDDNPKSWISVDAANDIASKIRSLVDLNRNPHLTYIVIVGNDEIIPFYRSKNRHFMSEKEYFKGEYPNSAVANSLNENYILTDNYYGDFSYFISRDYVPEYSISRLIETPNQILNILKLYLENQSGYIRLNNGVHASGAIETDVISQYSYDVIKKFSNSSQPHFDNPNWTFEDLMSEFSGKNNDYFLIGNHAAKKRNDQQRLGTVTCDRLSSINSLHEGIIITAGCHTGLNIPNKTFTQNELILKDLSESSFIIPVATFLGSTGFASVNTSNSNLRSYGLIAKYFIDYIAEGYDVGTALSLSKIDFRLNGFSILDFQNWRDLKGAVLYGLPYYKIVNIPIENVNKKVNQLNYYSSFKNYGINSINIEILPEKLEKNEGADCIQYLSSEELYTSEVGKPLIPYFECDLLSIPADKEIHDVKLVQSISSFDKLIKPLATNESHIFPEYEVLNKVLSEDSLWYPNIFYKINKLKFKDSVKVKVLYTALQYNEFLKSVRIFDKLQFRIIYTNEISNDNEGPYWGNQSISPLIPETGKEISFNILVNDSSGVDSVFLYYSTDNGLSWAIKNCSLTSENGKYISSIDNIFNKELYYYFKATDIIGNSSIDKPKNNYYKLNLYGNSSPTIYHTPIPSNNKGILTKISTKVVDKDQNLDTNKVFLYYMPSNSEQTDFHKVKMNYKPSNDKFSYTLNTLNYDTVFYYIQATDSIGSSTNFPMNFDKNNLLWFSNEHSVFIEYACDLPTNFHISQNYPNPFNPTTRINFSLPNSEFTILKVYNILGKEVAELVSTKLQQGSHTYTFDGSNLASGIYYYELVAGDYREVRKMLLVR